MFIRVLDSVATEPRGIFVLFIIGLTTYLGANALYSLYFHPLKSFPGPTANHLTTLRLVFWLWTGQLPQRIADLHRHYGSVVRIAPNELSFTDPEAWTDIYLKLDIDRTFYNAIGQASPSIIGCDREEHDRCRKLLGPNFSDRSIKLQEPMIREHADLLVRRLTENSVDANGRRRAVNMRDWLTYTTFDIFGKLAFGSELKCLEDSRCHQWVELVMGNIKDWALINGLSRLGVLSQAIAIMRVMGIGDHKRQLHVDFTTEWTKRRVQMDSDRIDLIGGLLRSEMSINQIAENAALLAVAGSETTATLLTGVVYLLATHPGVMKNLSEEVRGEFSTAGDIGLDRVTRLTYLTAVLNEGLRIYPPSPNAAPRCVGVGGARIAGHYVPEGATVGIWQWAVLHDADNFKDPLDFRPERWCGETLGSGDKLWTAKPFLIGPRSCLGRNLAYAEMRIILARLVFAFDLTLCSDSNSWLYGQRSYILWEKPPLNVELRPVSQSLATAG